MVSEVSDIKKFIAELTPFNDAEDAALDRISQNVSVDFQKAGKHLFDNIEKEKLPFLVILRSGSLEIRDKQNKLKDKLTAGDLFFPNILLSSPQPYALAVLEDCLFYELVGPTLQGLFNSDAKFKALLDGHQRIYNPEVKQEQDKGKLEEQNYRNQTLREFMSSPAICVGPNVSVQQAAILMRNKSISSLLVTEENRLVGIVTDRDFRTRVLAEALPLDTPLFKVMTHSPSAIEANRSLHEAQMSMMSAGIHHLPVVKGELPIGIISLSDILQASNTEPLSLISTIKNADSSEELAELATRLPELVANLIERDTRAMEIGEVITSFTDAMTKRLLILATDQFGPSPVPYTWLAFGSQARQEQMLGSDQDNAIIFSRALKNEDEHEYFDKLTHFVNDGLHHCGIPHCPGNIMASNTKWQLSLNDWKRCFTEWIKRPSPKALMHASIFFDMRRVHGKPDLVESLQAYVLKLARQNTIFQALMTNNSLDHTPPLGFFKTFVLEDDGNHVHSLDLKKRGTIPIVDFARNYVLSAGLTQVNTLSRLQALREENVVSNELASSLIDAHEFIAGIRLESQAQEYRANARVDNYLDPRELSPLLRQQLKEAFQVVRNAQTAMKARFGAGVF